MILAPNRGDQPFSCPEIAGCCTDTVRDRPEEMLVAVRKKEAGKQAWCPAGAICCSFVVVYRQELFGIYRGTGFYV
jgi:hypothetical protein